MIRRVSVIASTVLAAGVVALMAAPSAVAQATEDPRATRHEGNVTTCAGAGLTGQKLALQQGTHYIIDPTNRYVTIIAIPDGFELTGTVVKGGPAYNVYGPEHRLLLRSPLNKGGNIPAISHWFACGKTTTTTTTTTPTTTTTTTTTTASEPTTTTTTSGGTGTTTSDGATTTTTPGGGGGGDTGDGGLAETGASVRGPLMAGAGLLVLGTVLLFLVRRRGLHRR